MPTLTVTRSDQLATCESDAPAFDRSRLIYGSKLIKETQIDAAAMGSSKTDESARKKLEKYGERMLRLLLKFSNESFAARPSLSQCFSGRPAMLPLYVTQCMRSRFVIQLLANNECDPLVSAKPG
jgi:hypothetical protein